MNAADACRPSRRHASWLTQTCVAAEHVQDALTALPFVPAAVTRAPQGHFSAAVAHVVGGHYRAWWLKEEQCSGTHRKWDRYAQVTSSLSFGLTYETRVGLQAHGSALTYTARGRPGRGLAVLLEIGEPGSETQTATQDVFRKKKTLPLLCGWCRPKIFMQYNHCLVQLQRYSETCQQLLLLSGIKLKSTVCSVRQQNPEGKPLLKPFLHIYEKAESPKHQ